MSALGGLPLLPTRSLIIGNIGTGHRLRLASAGLAVTTATVATAGAGGLLGLIGGLLAVVGAASIAVAESCTKNLVPCTQCHLSSRNR